MPREEKESAQPAGKENPAQESAPDEEHLERLQKYMARRGVDSRRNCEELIATGRVKVNGETVTELGTKVDPLRDSVSVDGTSLTPATEHYYLAVNKPKGFITACSDQHGSRLVTEFVPKRYLKVGVIPVGRLDKSSSGLLLFTNDGELAYRLTHPKYSVWKTYRVRVKGNPLRGAYRHLEEGVRIDGKLTAPAKVKQKKRAKGYAEMVISIHEGRNRQVRKMCKAVGHPVLELTRTKVGPVVLGTLKSGGCRSLTGAETKELKKEVGLR